MTDTKALAIAMSVILVFTSVDLTAFAGTAQDKENITYEITNISSLSDDILNQEVICGTEFGDIEFPKTISGTVKTTISEHNNSAAASSDASSTASSDASTESSSESESSSSETSSENSSSDITDENGAVAGTYYLKAYVSRNANVDELEEKISFVIKPAPGQGEEADKIITITAPSKEITYGDSFDVSKITEAMCVISGLDDGQSLSDVSTGSLSFNTSYVQGDNAGTYKIFPAGLSARTGYEIVFADGDLTVNQKELTLSWTGTSFIYDEKEHSAKALAESGVLSGDTLYVTGYELDTDNNIRASATDAGTYTAHAVSFGGIGHGNYRVSDASASSTWTISKAPAGDGGNEFITEPYIDGWTYGDEAKKPTGKALYGDVSFLYRSSMNDGYVTAKPENAGTYYMKAYVNESGNYAGLESSPVSFTITPRTVNIAADDVTGAKGAAIAKLSYTMSGALAAGDNLLVSLTTTCTSASNTGDYPITVSYTPNSNYDVTTVDGTYHIVPSSEQLQVTQSGYSGIYDGKAHGISVSAKSPSGKSLNGVEVFYSETELNDYNYGKGLSNSPQRTDAGTTKVYFCVTCDGYKNFYGSEDIVISKKVLTVTARNASIVYGDTPTNNGVSFEGFEGGDTAESLGLIPTYSYTYSQYGNCGTYYKSIVPGGLPANNDYSYKYLSGTITVTKKATAVGNYKAIVSGLAGDKASNYSFDAAQDNSSFDWNIGSGRNAFTVDPSIDEWVYGDTASLPNAEALYGTVKYSYSDTESGEYTSALPSDAGTYYMKASVSETKDYPYIESAPVPFTIRKRSVSVNAGSMSSKEGEEIGELKYTISDSSVSADDLNVSISTTATSDSEAGDYPITVTCNAGDNYDVSLVNGTYTITDKNLDISASSSDYAGEYDGELHSIKVNVNAGDGVDYKVYYSISSISSVQDASRADVYTDISKVSYKSASMDSYKVYYLVASSNTTILKGMGKVSISKKKLTITADAISADYGQSAVYTASSSGLVPGETLSNLSGELSFNCSYQKGSSAGEYVITPLGLSSENYDIAYVSGKLSVSKTVIILGASKDNTLIYDGTPKSGITGEPYVADNEVTDFSYTYSRSSGEALSGQPTDAGDYKVVISVPSSNRFYRGSKEISFTISRKKVTVSPKNQVIIEGQKIDTSFANYEGFVNDDNASDKAIESGAEVVETTSDGDGSNLTAGTYALKIRSTGTLSSEALVNYELVSSPSNSELKVVKASSENDDSGSDVKPSEDSGTIRTAVVASDDRLSDVTLESNLTKSTALSLLTEDEKLEVTENGKDALIYLVLEDASSDQSIASAADSFGDVNVDQIFYFELTLFKKVGDSSPEQISQTNGTSVRITMTIPDELINTDPDIVRTYLVIYDHEGNIRTISPSIDGTTMSFDAGSFSTYSITYTDKEVSNQPSSPGSGSGGNDNGGQSGGQGSDSNDNHEKESDSQITVAKPVSNVGISAVINPDGGEQAGISNDDEAANKKSSKIKTNDNTDEKSDSSDAGKSYAVSDTDTNKKENNNDLSKNKVQSVSPDLSNDKEIGKEDRLQLQDALKKIQKLDGDIVGGPYVVLSDEEKKAADGADKVQIIITIPDELMKDGRVFYLTYVDKDGNVIVLSNDSIEDGVICATGDPDAVYQIIYEDNGAKLLENLGPDGQLIGESGKEVTVKTNHCYWHYIILLIGLIGAFLTLVFRKRRRPAIITGVVTVILMLICTYFGLCALDVLMLGVGLLMMVITYSIITIVKVVCKFYRLRKKRAENNRK